MRSCRSAAAANTSASAEHLVPRLRPGPLDHVQRSHVELQFSISSPEWNCQSASLARGGPFVCAAACLAVSRYLATAGLMLSCICTPARRIPRRPSNLTFVAVPNSLCKHLLQHISSTTISTKRSMEPLGGRRGSATGNGRDLTRSCLGHLPLHRQQPAGTRAFSALCSNRVRISSF